MRKLVETNIEARLRALEQARKDITERIKRLTKTVPATVKAKAAKGETGPKVAPQVKCSPRKRRP